MREIIQTLKQVMTSMLSILKKTTTILLVFCFYVLLFIYLPGELIFFVFNGMPTIAGALFACWFVIVAAVSIREIIENYMK